MAKPFFFTLPFVVLNGERRGREGGADGVLVCFEIHSVANRHRRNLVQSHQHLLKAAQRIITMLTCVCNINDGVAAFKGRRTNNFSRSNGCGSRR